MQQDKDIPTISLKVPTGWDKLDDGKQWTQIIVTKVRYRRK